uniref:ARAD1A13398p n=1 Tax=Blastobotrys adeninivorans TaxID=409370 RepID=A0A060T407_BLAAD
MVKVEKVDDEHRFAPTVEDDADYTDVSDTEELAAEDDYDDFDPESESLMDRVVALKDVVPPAYRSKLTSVFSTASKGITGTLFYGGKALWIATTSSLLLGVPLALSIVSEQQLIEMEKEMKLSQSTNEVLAPGAEGGFQQPPAPAA